MTGPIVVCGATGALGRAVVAEMCSSGKEVIAVGRSIRFPNELLQAWPDGQVRPLAADLSDSAAVERLWTQIDEVGTPSALVNVVGGFRSGSVSDSDEEIYHLMLELNLSTTWWSCRWGAIRLAGRGGGAIVNVAARAALRGGAGSAAYTVAKAGVVRLTEVLAAELSPSRVRVNVVMPAVIDTQANRASMADKSLADAVPPESISKVIAFLASDDAWPISGAAIPVYGWG
jgi:NAD(P)-dependent dehydrogenase (short-subunit alcohol dehydrogenase family)